MQTKNYISLLFFTFFILNVNAQSKPNFNSDQSAVITIVRNAQNYIEKNGKEKAIHEFKNHSYDILLGDYNGLFYVSPLHPELIGRNQFHYKDSTGAFVVQEEIAKAKSGGGWLKGRLRKNPQTGKYECRKIYILPMPDDYYIGSWYHYPLGKNEMCLVSLFSIDKMVA